MDSVVRGRSETDSHPSPPHFDSPDLLYENDRLGLGHHRHDPDGRSRSSPDLHGKSQQRGPRRGNPIQVRHVLQIVDPCRCQDLMGDEIFRLAVVDAGRINAITRDMALLDEKLGGLSREPGEMEPRHVARLVGSQVAPFVGPVLAPARSD
jgi:hypothetical protein